MLSSVDYVTQRGACPTSETLTCVNCGVGLSNHCIFRRTRYMVLQNGAKETTALIFAMMCGVLALFCSGSARETSVLGRSVGPTMRMLRMRLGGECSCRWSQSGSQLTRVQKVRPRQCKLNNLCVVPICRKCFLRINWDTADPIHSCLAVSDPIHSCLAVSDPIHSCLAVSTLIHSCLAVSDLVHSCLAILDLVYSCFAISQLVHLFLAISD
jgi:hypothetical protein